MTAPLRHTDPAAPSRTPRAGAAAGGASSLSPWRRLVRWSDRIQNSVVGDVIGVLSIFAITGGMMVIAVAVTP